MNRSPAYELYTNLLKASLVGSLAEIVPQSQKVNTARMLDEAKQRFGDALVAGITPDTLSWLLNANARSADTLAPPTQLDALQACIETVVDDGVPGDLIEAGCFRGGQCVLMSGVLKALDATNRAIIAADSFEGLPKPELTDSPDDAVFYFFLDAIGRFRTSRTQTCEVMQRYGLLDDRFQIIEGWFHRSLADASLGPLAIIRLDATFHDSTRDALNALYPMLSTGGFVICADYGVPTGARRAVEEFRRDQGIDEPFTAIDGQGVLWRRESDRES